MSKAEEKSVVKKITKTKSEEVKIPFVLVNYLSDKILLLKAPTYGDIESFKAIQETLGKVNTELQGKISEIFKKYGVTEVEKEDKHFEDINKEYHELMKQDSEIPRSELQVFSKEDFARVYPDNLNVNDAITLEYWLVK